MPALQHVSDEVQYNILIEVVIDLVGKVIWVREPRRRLYPFFVRYIRKVYNCIFREGKGREGKRKVAEFENTL